jgi:hypothetical protein
MMCSISKKLFSTSFTERDFNDGEWFSTIVQGQLIQPIKNVQSIATAGATTTITFTSRGFAIFTCTATTTAHLVNIYI